MSIAVTTRSFDNRRTGANLAETVLTQQSVGRRGIRLLFACDMPGDARGSEGAALVVPGLTMGDGLAHDVLFQANMGNYVCAWDADTGRPLWQRLVGNPIPGTRAMDMYGINDHWGILSTPAINVAAGVIYAVAMTSPTGRLADARFVFHALSLTDGRDTAAPLDLTAATYRPPGGLRLQRMGTVPRKQRCGLALDVRNGASTVFVANGSFDEDAATNQGWVIAVDVTAGPAIAAAWTTTSRYSGGGVWMGGQGVSVDDDGFVYLSVGNGAFDGVTDFGESFCKLRYTPRRGTAAATLGIVDWFTPFTDTGRMGGAECQTLADTSLIPGGGRDDDAAGATSNMDSAGDEDLNSGGPLLIRRADSGLGKDLVVGAGKDGIVYVMDAADLGRPALADFAPGTIGAKVYGKLLSPPVFFTYYHPTADPAPTDLSTLPTTYGQRTHHQHGTPVFYKSPAHGPMLFTMGENGNLRAWRINGDYTLAYLACSAEYASPEAAVPFGGMPGGMLSLSADGGAAGSAVVWACVPYGDANKTVTNGRLLAYAADDFGTFADGSGALRKLWDSQDWGVAFLHNKFNIPVAVNGKVYCPTYQGQVLVFGLA